jgi:TonB family protein
VKKIIFFAFLFLGFTSAYSQDTVTADSAAYYNKVFLVVQEKPKFPGSESKWMAEHTVYPKQAIDSNIQGTVYVNFVIEKDGSVSSPSILSGVHALNEEALGVIKSMPKWTPGIENGHSARVQLMLPVKFKLIDPDTTIYHMVQIKPVFPGDINKWLAAHIVYPKDAMANNIEGTVYVSFVIENDGSVSSVKLLRGVNNGASLEKEAMKVIAAMPKWNPGVQNEHFVRVQYMLPIRFILRDDLLLNKGITK